MADAPNLDTLTALVAAQDATRQQLTGQATGLAAQAASDFAAWYSTDAITAWAHQVADNVGAVLHVLAGMVDAYLATIISELTGRHMRPVGTIDVGAIRTGVTPAGVYGRVADTYRWQQSRLDSAARTLAAAPNPTPPQLQTPLDAALQRASQVSDLNTQLVVQRQSAKTMSDAGQRGLVVGWRRILHPELSKGGSCGLCVAASTRTYRSDHLMPIHHDCHCLPMPITEAHDPGSIINDSDLGRLYTDAGSTSAADLKKTRYQVTDNGELGPVLAPAGAKLRTARQVAADTSPTPPRPQSANRQRAKLRTLHDSLARSLQRVDTELLPADPAQWEPYRQTLAERVNDLEQQLAA